jgi:hypothetical protein
MSRSEVSRYILIGGRDPKREVRFKLMEGIDALNIDMA